MSQIALVRLFIRICNAVEFWLVPQSVRWASALYRGVRKLPEKFRFRPPADQTFLVNLTTLRLWCGPWLWRLLRHPADWLLFCWHCFCKVRSWIRRAAARRPVWLARFLRWLRFALVDALVIGGGVALLALLWLRVFDFC